MPAAKRRRKGATAKIRKRTLLLPSSQGVRLVALGFLEDADTASRRLARSHSSKALHDFRVALRRLRSWMRSFEQEFDGLAKRKDRRDLHDITTATNLGRDVDVQLLWLRRAGKKASAKRKRGAEWMKEYLTTRLEADPVDADLLKKFSRLRKDLSQRLSRVERPRNASQVGPTLASAIVSRLTSHVEELDEALAEVGSVADELQAHKARITAKRLRYLLEPAAPHVKHGAEVLLMLKSLQDELGSLHDAHVLRHELGAAMEPSSVARVTRLAKRAIGRATARNDGDGPRAEQMSNVPKSALATLALRLGADAQKAFDRVHEDWLSDRYARFKRELAGFARQLDETYGGAK